MRGKLISVPFSATITAANTDVDLVEVQPGDDETWVLIGLKLGQTSEIADAQEEGIGIQIVRQTGAFTSGSGGATPTPGYERTGDPAHGATLESMNPTIGSGGTQLVLEDWAWNLRGSPLEMWWDSDRAWQFSQGEAATVRWNTTVSDDVAVRGTAFFELLT
jgi:hypothetical protein